MRSIRNCVLMAGVLTLGSFSIEAAGFKKMLVNDPGHPDLVVGLWYPSDQPAPDEPNTEFELAVALNAPLSGTNGGLILMSHGFGGWYAGHADTAAALADQGFVVAAPTHTGNTWSDMSSTIDQWALDRPRHISRVIDHLLGDEDLKQTFDADKIGIYGFSAGGYTALGLIGGTPDFNQAMQHCSTPREETACADRMIETMHAANMHQLPLKAWGADKRIKAASIAAPGLGFAYSGDTLAGVEASVQLWSGQLDVQVPTNSNAQNIASNLPTEPETHWIDKATHFAFMTVSCREAFKQNDPDEYKIICGDADGFDRYEFNRSMQIEMGRFFRENLNI